MKKIGMQMSILMGVSLSFCLSLVGSLSSGHFAVPTFLLSFLLSTIISLIIGFLVPMKKVNDSLDSKLGLQPGKFSTHLFDSLISDLIYTPIITLAMVFLNWKIATAHGAQIPFGPMFVKSLILSMLVGYLLIFVLMPLFLKLVMRNMPGGPGMPGKPSAPDGPGAGQGL